MSYFVNRWRPKVLLEALCAQAVYAPDRPTREAIKHLVELLHLHRPVGIDGKHGDLHTPTCGCEEES